VAPTIALEPGVTVQEVVLHQFPPPTLLRMFTSTMGKSVVMMALRTSVSRASREVAVRGKPSPRVPWTNPAEKRISVNRSLHLSPKRLRSNRFSSTSASPHAHCPLSSAHRTPAWQKIGSRSSPNWETPPQAQSQYVRATPFDRQNGGFHLLEPLSMQREHYIRRFWPGKLRPSSSPLLETGDDPGDADSLAFRATPCDSSCNVSIFGTASDDPRCPTV
jgi:hypothetical protein